MKGDKPFPRVVVPTDGSHLSESAAYAAAALARRAGVPLTLFGVTYSDDDRDDLSNALNELITTLRRDLVVDVIVDVLGAAATVDAFVAAAILEEADVDGAVVCMASHGRGGLGAALLGSITEEVLRKSQRPVLVVGPKFEARPWRSDGMIVASVDGSAFSEQATPVAEEWSAIVGSQLWLVQVAAPFAGSMPDVVIGGDVSEFAYLKHLSERAGNANFDVLHSRHPAKELADLAERLPVDVIVMATHGRSGWSRLTLGSVAMNVVHHAICPVLLVPPVHAAEAAQVDDDEVER
jgi:nucleotide-binding universal stress UspA family protein